MQPVPTQPASLRELVSTLFVYQPLVLVLTALFGGAALVVSYVQPEIYEASVQVWAQDQSVGLRKASDYSTEITARIKMVLTNLQGVIFSRPVLEATLERCGMLPPRAAGSHRGGAATVDDEIARLRRAIRLEAPKGSDFGTTQIFFLRVHDRDPDRAKQLLEALLESFRHRYEQLSAEQAKHLYSETSRQVDGSRARLKESEQALDAFVARLGAGVLEVSSIGSSSGNESELRRALGSVNERLVPARAELEERRALFAQLEQAKAGATLAVPGSFLRDYPALEHSSRALGETRLQLDVLATRTTPEHPDYRMFEDRLVRVEQTYRKELELAMRAMQREIAAKREVVDHLYRQRDEYVARLAELAGQYVSYEGLKEEVRQRRTIVEDAEKRRSDAAHALVTAAQEVLLSTVDPPRVKAEPVSPRRVLNVALGTLLGLLTGIGLAFLARHYSRTVRSESDLLGLGDDMVIVSVPRVRTPLEKAI